MPAGVTRSDAERSVDVVASLRPVGFRPQSVRGTDGPGEIDYRLARQYVLSEFR